MTALALTAALAFPIHAHTVAQLEEWRADWSSRASVELSEELMAERRDMHARHLWYFAPPPELRMTATRQSTAIEPPHTPASPSFVEQWRSMVAFFWPADQVDLMLKIIACESGGDPGVPNSEGSGALGLFQIMEFWQRDWPGDYTDPWTNGAVAFQIWLSQGLGAWRSSRGCWG